MVESSSATGSRLGRLVLVALVVAVVAAGPAVAHSGDDGAHHHDGQMGTHGGMWGMGWWGWFLWPALILLGSFVAYSLLRRSGDGGESDRALTALRERYARGEIDEEEFERRRQTLQEH